MPCLDRCTYTIDRSPDVARLGGRDLKSRRFESLFIETAGKLSKKDDGVQLFRSTGVVCWLELVVESGQGRPNNMDNGPNAGLLYRRDQVDIRGARNKDSKVAARLRCPRIDEQINGTRSHRKRVGVTGKRGGTWNAGGQPDPEL